MRPTLWMLALLWGCPATGIPTTTDTKTDNNADADADADTDSDTDADTDTYLAECPDQPDALGPWATHPITEAGAGWTYDPYPFDGGVAAVRTAALGSTATGTYGSPVDLAVTKAIVTSRGYVPANPTENTATFWFEDGTASMMAFIVDIGIDPNGLNPGDEVAFTVTGVKNFFDTPEVTSVADFQIVSSGNDVHIVDAMTGGDPLDFDTNGLQTVEVWGQLVSGPTDCSSNCWDYQYGGNVVTFRSDSSYDYLGDCIHYIGPLGLFGGSAQLDASEFDWYYRF